MRLACYLQEPGAIAECWVRLRLVLRQLAAEKNPLAEKLVAGSMTHIDTPATWPATRITQCQRRMRQALERRSEGTRHSRSSGN